MRTTWELKEIAEIGDLIGYTVRLICEDGSYTGGLLNIDHEHIMIEIDEGSVLALSRDVLLEEYVELYMLKEVL